MEKNKSDLQIIHSALQALTTTKQKAETLCDLPDLVGPNGRVDKTTPFGVGVVRLEDADRVLESARSATKVAPQTVAPAMQAPPTPPPSVAQHAVPELSSESLVPVTVATLSNPPASAFSGEWLGDDRMAPPTAALPAASDMAIVRPDPWYLRWFRRLSRWLRRFR